MKNILWIFVFMVFNFANSTSPINKSIHFDTNDIDYISQKAKKENKLIMVFVYSDHGSWCDKMRNNTFKNKDVLLILHKNYISVEFDRFKDEINIPDSIEVDIVPSIFLIDPKTMEILSQTNGYIGGKSLADKLDDTVYFHNN